MLTKPWYLPLALAGTLPFIACALLPFLGLSNIPGLGPTDVLASSYGLAIVCFIAGTHWGNNIVAQERAPLNLFLSSNLIFLLTWFAFIGGSASVAIATQITAFLALLFTDYRLKVTGMISNHYFQIRATATLVAVVSLSTLLFAA